MFEKLFYLHLLFANDGDNQDAGGGSKDDSKSVDDAVKKATKEVSNETTEDENENEENNEDENEDEEDELTEEQQVQAKSIFKLLNNPETSINALKILAAQAGLKLEAIETTQEEKKVKKAIKEIVKEKLGSKYSFLSEDLGDLLEELFNTQVSEKTKDIRDEISAAKKEILVKEINTAQEKVTSEYVDIPVSVLKEFVRMQESGEVVLGPKQSPERFFRAGIREAAENLKISLVRKQNSNNENRSERKKSPLDELASKSRHSSESGKDGIKSTQVKNFNDAIKLGVDAVEKSLKKG